MLTLHPSILERDGKKAFAVLPYEEFLTIQEALNDFEDLKLGRYELYATWTASTSRTSVRYSVFAGGAKPVKSFAVNQTDAPCSLYAGGTWWHSLGIIDVGNGSVKVRLTNQGRKKNNIVADAIAIAARPKPATAKTPKPAR